MIGVAAMAVLAACARTTDSPVAPLGTGNISSPSVAAPAAGIASPTTLVISEIMANPATIDDGVGEWFELHNPGTEAVSLAGFQIASANDPSVTITGAISIAPGGYIVMARSTDNAVNGGLNAVFSFGTLALANGATDWLAIRDANGATIDSVFWGATPPTGASRAKRSMVVDCTPMGDARAWGTATTNYVASNRGTPNLANDVSGYTAPNLCGGAAPGGPVTAVTVTPNPASVALGATRAFTAVGRDAGGVTVSTTFTWTSSDPTVATVNPTNGVATPVSLGTTTITATSANGIAGTAVLTVTEPGAIATVTVGGATIPAGFQTQIFGTARDADNVIVQTTFTWSVNPADVSVASVDANGVITGLTPGTARIIATAPNGVSGSATVTITTAVFASPTVYGNQLEFGAPTDNNASDDFIIRRNGYALSYNRNHGIPNWVSYNLDASQFGTEDRCNCFTNDPAVIAQGFPVIKTSDYTNGGFDRGHMVRSADRTLTNGENGTTFYLSNVVPQQADLNQGVWANHENFIADLARVSNKEVYIITGPAFSGAIRTIKDEGKIRIPDFTWKIVIAMDRDKGLADLRDWSDVSGIQVIAVNMPNIAGIRNADWRTYVVSVDSLERLTGYDFLASLPDMFENALEAGDRPPVANLAGPTTGVEGASLTFSGAGSTDPDAGDVLTYRWRFSDGSTATGAAVTKTFADNGSYTATLIVTDRFGWESTTSQAITVSNDAPVATLGTPSGTTVRANTGWLTQLRFSDAGLRDGPWRIRYSWGDGTTFNATSVSQPTTTPLQRGKTWSTPARTS